MSDLICKLHEIAVYFHRINMRQTAGDLDYIASWLRSPLWNHGEHLKPDPAGENTVDAYSHNCPIPYTANLNLIDRCSDLDAAIVYVGMAKDTLEQLALLYDSDEEETAINCYTEYLDDLYSIITGEDPPEPPEPPVPPEPTLYALYNAMDAITDTALNAAPVAIPIARGGKSPTGGRDIAVIDYPNIEIIDLS